MNKTFRDTVEEKLLKIPGVRPLNEQNARYIEDFKDGTFGLTYLGFLLYCTGRNPKGLSTQNPKGLIYFDGENGFGIGIFRREGENDFGHIMAIAPRGLNSVNAIQKFYEKIILIPELKGKMFYIRFLKVEQYKQLLQINYQPVQEFPWHDEAFAEDETYSNSVIKIDELFEYSDNLTRQDKLYLKSKNNRENLNRFKNFLSRSKFKWKWSRYNPIEAKNIVENHFKTLEEKHKRIGSMPEDYYNLLETNYSNKFSIIGKITKADIEIPISVFIGEKTAENKLAIYCSISRRNPELIQELETNNELEGFTALSAYALLNCFAEIKIRMPEIEEIDLGGSETADLNAFKRRLGCKNNPTYWVVKQIK